ncbi:MAG: phosphatase PAP2 family protein, partial [Lachnospiraceae bacterium]|nr:phosphatase PAP2 family protein [Lachnospiraceae bacterium]
LGLIPVFICMIFAGVGLKQWINRRKLFKVDYDILILGIYYVAVILSYLVFEMIPINYRPILIDGRMEVSYPSSTTLLVLCVMPTLIEQTMRRLKHIKLKLIIRVVTVWFSVFMVLGRLVSGVHWFTDIVGAMILSAGLFLIYKGVVIFKSNMV